MTYGDIFNEFKEATGISEDCLVDYRPCAKRYADVDINGAICIQLKGGQKLIYESSEAVNGATYEEEIDEMANSLLGDPWRLKQFLRNYDITTKKLHGDMYVKGIPFWSNPHKVAEKVGGKG